MNHTFNGRANEGTCFICAISIFQVVVEISYSATITFGYKIGKNSEKPGSFVYHGPKAGRVANFSPPYRAIIQVNLSRLHTLTRSDIHLSRDELIRIKGGWLLWLITKKGSSCPQTMSTPRPRCQEPAQGQYCGQKEKRKKKSWLSLTIFFFMNQSAAIN